MGWGLYITVPLARLGWRFGSTTCRAYLSRVTEQELRRVADDADDLCRAYADELIALAAATPTSDDIEALPSRVRSLTDDLREETWKGWLATQALEDRNGVEVDA